MPPLTKPGPIRTAQTPLERVREPSAPGVLHEALAGPILYLTGVGADPLLPSDGVFRIWARGDQSVVWGAMGTQTPQQIWPPVGGGVTNHSLLSNLVSPEDDHTQYALLAGRGTTQTLLGGGASGSLALQGSGGDSTVGTAIFRTTGTVSSPHVEFNDGATGDAYMRLENRVGIATNPVANTVLSIGVPNIGSLLLNVVNFTGTRVATANGQSLTTLGMGTSFNASGKTGLIVHGGLVNIGASDTIGGGSFALGAGLKVNNNIAHSGVINYLAGFYFPHTSANCQALELVGFDFGDWDDSCAGAFGGTQVVMSALRIGDRGVRDPNLFGSSFMSSGGTVNPILQEQTTAAMLIASGNAGAFYNVFAGNTVFGVKAPPTNISCAVEIGGTVGSLLLSRLTTTQRNALTAVNGMVLYNTTTLQVEGYQNGTWGAFGGGDTGIFLLLAGRAGGQVAQGDSAASGNLTLYGGSNHASTTSRIIIGSDAKFATANYVWRNASDQVILQQVSGTPAVIFPGDINANANINIGTFAGSQAVIRKVAQSTAPALTWGAGAGSPGRLMPIPFAAAANSPDDIIADRAAVTRIAINSGGTTNGAPVIPVVSFIGDSASSGHNVASDLLLFGASTSECLIKATKTAPVFTGTGTGMMHFFPSQHPYAADTSFRIEIDFAGDETAATFRWSDTGGASWNASGIGVSTAASIQLGTTNIFVNFSPGNYVLADRWDFTAIGTVNQVELLRADTTNDQLNVRNLVASPTTGAFTSVLRSIFTYTGGSTPTAWSLTLLHQGSGATPGALQVSVQGQTASNLTQLQGIGVTVSTGVSQTGTITYARAIRVQTPVYIGSKPDSALAVEIEDIGHASIGNVNPFVIRAQTAGSLSTINVWQQGTTGVNRFAAPTLVGSDASPVATTFAVSGGSVSPGAGVSAQVMLVEGTLVEAGSGTHAVMAGLRINAPTITNNAAATSDAVSLYVAAAPTVGTRMWGLFVDAGNVRIDDQVVLGATAVSTGTRLYVATWPSLGGGTHNLFQVNLAGSQSAAAAAKRGFAFTTNAYDLNGNNLTTFVGISSQPGISDGTVSATLTNYRSFEGGFQSSGANVAAITDSAVFWAVAPVNSAFSPVTTHRGFYAENQGDSSTTNAIGMDIAAQSGAAGTNIGVRIGLGATYSLQLSDTGGTAAGGAMFGASGLSNLYRPSADKLKTDGDFVCRSIDTGQGARELAAGQTILDFGAFPGVSDASVAITGQTGIGTGSIVLCELTPVATADHTADEHLVESLRVFAGNVVAGTGFTIYGRNDGQVGNTRIYGKWTVNWSWN